MKSVAQHLEECLAVAEPIAPFESGLHDALGCILAEDVRATIDVPVAAIAMIDGYAVTAQDIAEASQDNPIVLPVTDEVFASTTETLRHVDGAAERVASGARLPQGADVVVPLDATDHGIARVFISRSFSEGAFIRSQGWDMAAGRTILEAGTRIGARHIAALAAAGRNRVVVHPAPRVVVLSIGDELVQPGRALSPGRVYDANSHALEASAQQAGAVVYRVGAVSDDRNVLRDALEDQLLRADVIITTGGLSYGGGDTVKDVLSPLGSVRFDNVAIHPGRQFGVGTLNEGNTRIFCLPGDPAAALVSFDIFVRPALRKMAGYLHTRNRSIMAAAADSIESASGIREFLPVRVGGNPKDGYEFGVTGAAENPTLSSIAAANGLAVIPEETTHVEAGERIECLIFTD